MGHSEFVAVMTARLIRLVYLLTWFYVGFHTNRRLITLWTVAYLSTLTGCTGGVQHVAPVSDRPSVTVQEVVARRMRKFQAKLGIGENDLLPASFAFESKLRRGSGACGSSYKRVNDSREESPEVDIWRWKREAESMLDLLRPNSSTEYPFVDGRQKVNPENKFFEPWQVELWKKGCPAKQRREGIS